MTTGDVLSGHRREARRGQGPHGGIGAREPCRHLRDIARATQHPQALERGAREMVLFRPVEELPVDGRGLVPLPLAEEALPETKVRVNGIETLPARSLVERGRDHGLAA